MFEFSRRARQAGLETLADIQGCREGSQMGKLLWGPLLWEGLGQTCDVNEVGL